VSMTANSYRVPSIRIRVSFLVGGLFLLLYIFLFSYFYEHNVYPKWEYFGFRLSENNDELYFLGVACSLFGFLFLPTRAKAASDYVHWLLYTLSFVPIQITIGLSNSLNTGVAAYQLSLLISFILSVTISKAAYGIRWVPPNAQTTSRRRKTLRKGTYTRLFIAFIVLIQVILVVRFHSIMRFSGIEDIYTQRASASEFGIGALFGYLILWSTYLFAPLLLAIGLHIGRKDFILLSFAVLSTIFMITASKSTFVVFSFILLVHLFNKINFPRRMHLLFLIPVLSISIAITVNLSTDSSFGYVASYLIDQIVLRGIAIQAMIFNLYLEFFSNNPLTYYSHITGISALVDYPYDLPVGRVISEYQFGHPNANANSGVWATDGVAAAGPIGVLLVGILLGGFLGLANRITRSVNDKFLSLTLVPLAMLLTNVSMFTALASGGGFVLVLLIKRLWRDISPEVAPGNWTVG